jgi:hemolysin activation/secretion protein
MCAGRALRAVAAALAFLGLPIAVAMAQPAPAAATQAHFNIDEIQVQGNTILPATAIERAVYDFTGPDKTVEDIEHARAALEALYIARGYPTVSAAIPRQSVAGGVVVLMVTERRVGRLRVTGSRYNSLAVIEEHAPSLAEGKVPDINDVQRDITGLNQQPERVVTPVMRAGRTPGTVDVDLQVTDRPPVHGSLELNNQQSVDTTPLRLSGSVGYDNLWQRGDSASLYFQVAPQRPSDALIFSASYLFHIPGSRLSLLASYLKSDSNVSTVGATNVIGKGQIAGLRLVIPLVTGATSLQTLNIGIDYKDFAQDLTVSGAASQVPLQYYPLTASYQGNWNGATEQSDATISAVMGTPGLGTGVAGFEANRAYAEPSFIYFRGAASHLHDLPHGMQVWLHAQGQFAPQPLVPNEQFSVGGMQTVRGYLESEALGDTGGSLQIELRSPSYADAIGSPVSELRLHVFADVGAATIDQPLPEQRRSYTLDSVGSGVRIRLEHGLSASLEDAVTLSSAANTRAGANHVLFKLDGEF